MIGMPTPYMKLPENRAFQSADRVFGCRAASHDTCNVALLPCSIHANVGKLT